MSIENESRLLAVNTEQSLSGLPQKKRKKTLRYLLVLATVFSVAACSNPETPGLTNSRSPKTTSAELNGSNVDEKPNTLRKTYTMPEGGFLIPCQIQIDRFSDLNSKYKKGILTSGNVEIPFILYIGDFANLESLKLTDTTPRSDMVFRCVVTQFQEYLLIHKISVFDVNETFLSDRWIANMPDVLPNIND